VNKHIKEKTKFPEILSVLHRFVFHEIKMFGKSGNPSSEINMLVPPITLSLSRSNKAENVRTVLRAHRPVVFVPVGLP
jgi:hypothetical protein